jgi:hypothetical protein
MEIDVLEGWHLGSYFSNVGARGDERADERWCVAIEVGERQISK